MREKNKRIKFVAIQEDKPEDELFRSDVSLVGMGRNFIRNDRGFAVAIPAEEWAKESERLGNNSDYYHRPMRRPNGDTYWRKEKIAGGDLEAAVSELRPDHSRALEHMLKDRGIPREKIEEALETIRAEKVRLFEEIYGRKVVLLSEHTDSKHYHHDLWHLGLEPQEIEGKGGKKELIILRNPMRERSVGPGTARYWRHQQALAESGVDPTKVMGITTEVIKQNVAVAIEQNGEDPREIRFMQGLDSLVGKTLRSLSPKAYERGLKEYSAYLVENYPKGTVGARQIQPREARKIEGLEKENGSLKKLLELAVSIFSAVLKVPAFLQAVKAMNLYGKIVEFTRAVGIQLAPEAPEPVKSRTRTRRKTKAKVKLKERDIEMERSRKRKGPEEPSSPGMA
jgi:hypothetical protein